MVRILITTAMQTIHGDVLGKVMRAPINLFFDVTPTAKLVGRFNEDMGKFEELVWMIMHAVYCSMHLAMTLYSVGNSNPLTLLCVPVLLSYTWYLSGFTKGSYKEMHRLLATSSTPIHSHYSETMNGNSTIRAFGTEQYAIDRNLQLNDEKSVAFEMSITGLIWFSIQIRMASSALMLACGILCVMARHGSDPVMIAVAFQYIMELGDLYCGIIHIHANFERIFVSCQRALMLLDIPQENFDQE